MTVATGGIAGRKVFGVDQRLAGLVPRGKFALQRFGGHAFLAEPRGNALTQRTAVLANNDDIAPADGREHRVRFGVGPGNGARDEMRIAGCIVRARVNEQRAVGQSDKPGKLRNCDFCW